MKNAIYKSYKCRIYPNDAQVLLLDKHFNASRFIYNLALETKIASWDKGVNLTKFDLCKQLTDLKKDCKWLFEVSNVSLQESISDLDNAYQKFYKGGGFPSFKRKRDKNSFRCIKSVSIKGDKICIPKFQKANGIKIVFTNPIDGEIKSATISKTSTGKYFASVIVKAEKIVLPFNDNVVGIDLGLKTFAVLSDGNLFESPKFLRQSLDRLKVLQRRAARKKKGSANKRKAYLKVALIHERIANQRQDFLHNTSNRITNDYGTICIEDLHVKGLVKNHNLALSINDASWGEFVRQLTYKSQWKGRELITIGRFEPSSKKCSNCGNVKDMPLSERTYSCECGLVLDRDVNASRNIRNAGILRTEVSVELLPLGKTVKQKSCRKIT